MLWDLIQQFQISNRKDEVESVEQRVAQLENDLWATQQLLDKLMRRLEDRFGEDIDGDGKIG